MSRYRSVVRGRGLAVAVIALAASSAQAEWVRQPGCARSITGFGATNSQGVRTQWKIDCEGEAGTSNAFISRRTQEDGPWERVSGAAVKIALSPASTRPWVVNSFGQIFQWNGSGWVRDAANGCALDIAVGSFTDRPWVLGCDYPHSVWHWNGVNGWDPVGNGHGLAAGVGWVIGTDQRPYQWNRFGDGQWNGWDFPASVIHVHDGRGVSGLGPFEIQVVRQDNRIYTYAGNEAWNLTFDPIPSGLPIVALAHKTAVDLAGQIWSWR
jgi:hypothetical protein